MNDHSDPSGLTRKGFEALSNGISRHRFLDATVKGIVATLSAAALGNIGLQLVSADTCGFPYGQGGSNWGACKCCNGGAPQCSDNGGCPAQHGYLGCPSGYSMCTTSNSCNGYCVWGSGYWCCPCTSNLGWSVSYCVDCRKNVSGCTTCTCNFWQ